MDSSTYERLYDRMAPRLLRYLGSRVSDQEACEDMVQEIFISLWKKHETLTLESPEAYLMGAARMQVLRYIRSANDHKHFTEHFMLFLADRLDNGIEEKINEEALRRLLEEKLSSLPAKCQEAFKLSRFKSYSLDEIANRMEISKRTVENYITQALKHLRESMKNYEV